MKAPAAPGGAGAGGGPGGRLPARLRSALALLGGDGRRRSKAAAALGLAGERVALAEGPHLLAEAVGAGVRVACVVTTARARAGEAGRHVAALEAAGVPAYVVPEGEFARLAATRSPQGVMAAVVLPRPWTAADLAQGWRRGENALALALAGVQDPGNAGSLARTALAAGAFALALDPAGARADDPKAVRASQGALFRLPTARLAAAEAVAAARGAGARVAAAVPRGGVAPWRCDLGGPLLLVLGGEGAGLGPELAAAADVRVTLPMAAGESLGVAAAGAAVLYERLRQTGA